MAALPGPFARKREYAYEGGGFQPGLGGAPSHDDTGKGANRSATFLTLGGRAACPDCRPFETRFP